MSVLHKVLAAAANKSRGFRLKSSHCSVSVTVAIISVPLKIFRPHLNIVFPRLSLKMSFEIVLFYAEWYLCLVEYLVSQRDQTPWRSKYVYLQKQCVSTWVRENTGEDNWVWVGPLLVRLLRFQLEYKHA